MNNVIAFPQPESYPDPDDIVVIDLDPADYPKWKQELALRLGCDPDDILPPPEAS